ncbi:M42 family metallopeptidase [Natroniella sulfidigena]|uniref:M42 family metallopeptidase n=1 Tax=Natroniella sulfidigena TaxID=723921 RepID=UPI00200A9070|nr:M42 family metallopeptidase [Natroniella sulfidigena]MCK8816899.1 M42 family metallopeptidase [Natroniella sulfidigena]
MFLKQLSEAVGVSGREAEVRDLIRAEIKDDVDQIETDALGNLIAFKEGKPEYPTILLAAHMDEIGLMITDITDDGLLKFKPIGGIDKRILVSKQVVVGPDKIPGLIGAKAIHLQEPDERKNPLDYGELYIDIGTKEKEESEKLIELGMMATFATEFKHLGTDTVKGKAFDDRVGCAALVELLQQEHQLSIIAAFTVQEEIGLRGASVVAYDLDPDLALVVEGTSASDVPDSKEAGYSTQLGAGPALTVQDGSLIPSQPVVNKLIEVAKQNEIPYQFRKLTTAGTDAGAIHLTKEGIRTAVMSLPCRYIHSPASLINLNDYQATVKLLTKFCEEMEEGGLTDEGIN